MDRSSEFIKNKALFGSYPVQDQVNMFETIGVRYFVNLTCDEEKKITPYKTHYTYIHYPIPDRRVPTNWKNFSQFIIKIGTIIKKIKKGEKIYVHCKGGHGRSGIVVACLLCYLYKMTPADALSKTSMYHNHRKEMREKWRRMGSPQTRSQKHFVTKFFEPLYIYKNYTKYFSSGFSNDINIPVSIPGFGVFPNVTAAFTAYKDPKNVNFVKTMETMTNINNIRKLLYKKPNILNWLDVRGGIMYNILKLKFKQNQTITNHLLDTGLRPIIVCSTDPYWGKLDNSGKNILGRMLIILRKELYAN